MEKSHTVFLQDFRTELQQLKDRIQDLEKRLEALENEEESVPAEEAAVDFTGVEIGVPEESVETPEPLAYVPEPPAAEDLNEYILSALREKDLAFVSFFLHHYEEILNRRIRSFLIRDGSDQYDPERFLDIKLACRMKIFEKLEEYDPSSGAAFTTFLYPHISDALLEFRKGEEAWSLPSLTTYKMVRRMAHRRCGSVFEIRLES